MLKNEYIFVSVKTTGSHPIIDRIIEVGFCYVVDNIKFEGHYLINPGAVIPGSIQAFTGITQEMVNHAPSFHEVADKLFNLFKNKIIVAHNGRFDYIFLKNELKQCGFDLKVKVLCIKKLSHLLFPEENCHELDAIKKRFNLPIENNRAQGNAELTFNFFKHLQTIINNDVLTATINKLIKRSSLPLDISPEKINKIPQTNGVYQFYGKNNTLIYVGKSISLRDRVLSHFNADYTSAKEMSLARQIKSIDWIQTAGELGALLLEAMLIKEKTPIYNRRLRRYRKLYTIQVTINPKNYYQLETVCCDQINIDQYDHIYGLFRNQRSAEEMLKYLAKTYNLCDKLTNLEKGVKKCCFAYQLKRCKGACINKEPEKSYNFRVKSALANLAFHAWPYEGPIVIEETCNKIKRNDYHIIYKWCYIKTVNHKKEINKINSAIITPKFDLDIYQLLVKFLKSNKSDYRIIPYIEKVSLDG